MNLDEEIEKDFDAFLKEHFPHLKLVNYTDVHSIVRKAYEDAYRAGVDFGKYNT